MIAQDRLECPYCGHKHDEAEARMLINKKNLLRYHSSFSTICLNCKQTNLLILTKYKFIRYYPVEKKRNKRLIDKSNEQKSN